MTARDRIAVSLHKLAHRISPALALAHEQQIRDTAQQLAGIAINASFQQAAHELAADQHAAAMHRASVTRIAQSN